jgi:hypothetical protein
VLHRRASEKDLRRGLDTLPVMRDGDENDITLGPLDTHHATTSKWKDLAIVRAAETTFERGGWEVLDDRIVGIRRRPRQPGGAKVHLRPNSAKGLSTAALDRWELWTFDPAACRVRASPLAALEHHAYERADALASAATNRRLSFASERLDDDASGQGVPRLPFTRVSLFRGSHSYCLAGFGNTVGVFSVVACMDMERNLSMRLASRLKG